MIAQVIVDVTNAKVNHPFTYNVLETMQPFIAKGMRVIVPFKTRDVLGYVIEIQESEKPGLKDIKDILDLFPILNNEMFMLAQFMYTKMHMMHINCFQMLLPNALKVTYQKQLTPLDQDGNAFIDLFKSNVINQETFKKYYSQIYKMVKENKILVSDVIMKRERILTNRYLHLEKEIIVKNTKQQMIIDLLKSRDLLIKDLINDGCSMSSIKTLIKNGIINLYYEPKYRLIKKIYQEDQDDYALTIDQKKCIETIKKSTKPVLLHGVFNSGKTDVYIELIKDILNQNKTAIILFPEIALTTQMFERFSKHFPNKIAVSHLKLSEAELYDEWRKVKNGDAKIVIGTRNAIFMPLSNLGMIILDEEQDQLYEKEIYPNFSVLRIALFRAKYHDAKIVLGTATPKVTSYFKALNGEYQLVELENRILGIPPKMIMVNMQDELKLGNKKMFSNCLIEELHKTLNRHEQAIIMINQKGYASFVMCRECGHVIRCDKCLVSMTYYQHKDELKCDYCGTRKKMPIMCPNCASENIRKIGEGTEKTYEQLQLLFPEAKMAILDSENIKGKMDIEEILNLFYQAKIDILIGTEMVAKGLDFPNVTLIGILLADLYLNIPGYKNAEKTYSLISQVANRAGRGDKLGQVIIQSYNLNHYSIQASFLNDYQLFYYEEMKTRKLANYPPFSKMITTIIGNDNYQRAYKESYLVYDELFKIKQINLYGPIKIKPISFFYKYQMQIIIKYQANQEDIILKTIYDLENRLNTFYYLKYD